MVNDSAGTDVILVDKSQRPAPADGFQAAVAIEAERGLCNRPVLITGADDFEKVFGSPSFDKYGQANLEAYFLVQNNVPLVVARAKNPSLDPMASIFGCIQFQNKGGKLTVSSFGAPSISTPDTPNTAFLYFKGEGQYCCKDVNTSGPNIVLRFSKPATESAYAEKKRAFQLQVFDFAGHSHIDADTDGIMMLSPNLEQVLVSTGSDIGEQLGLDGYTLTFDSGSSGEDVKNKVVVYVNGVRGEAPGSYTGGSIYDAIAAAVLATGEIPSFINEGGGAFRIPKSANVNCRELSISVAIDVTAMGTPDDGVPRPKYYNYGCGSVSVAPVDQDIATVTFALSTSLYLKNRSEYMYMGEENAAWASFYAPFLRETFFVSLSHDDFNSSYVSMQLDAALAGSNYLVARTSETFDDYAISFATDAEPSAMVTELQYFPEKEATPDDGGIVSNAIPQGQRSYGYAMALRQIMGNNLTIWHCVVTPNLGDVINTPDFQGVIEAAHETTLGVSNLGKASSLDAFNNLDGRHGNRFIADFAQYGRRNVSGRRTWLTMACLVTLTLNNNFKVGNEARPPMGLSYGRIQCDELSETFTGPQRKRLSEIFKVNPAIDENGFYLWAETTSQAADSALSDTHVILSYCWMKYQIWASMRPFVAEYNDPPTVSDGLRILKGLNRTFKTRKYILEGKPNADKNVIGDKLMRFDFPVRFMGVANFVDIYVTAYPQTQSLEISLAEEG